MDISFGGWNQPIGVFTFVLAIVLIGSLFSWLKVRAQQETLREAMRSGIKLDPDALRSLENAAPTSKGGIILGGLICIAVSVAWVFFGYQIASIDGDSDVLTIFTGMASFPFLIGIVLVLVGLFRRGTGASGSED